MEGVVTTQEWLHGVSQPAQRRGLLTHQVGVERGRAAHRLARVVDDHVQARVLAAHHVTERLQHRQVAEVDAVHVQAVTPQPKVGQRGKAVSGVVREARGGNHRRAAPQQLQHRLEPNLHARTRHQRHAAAQVHHQVALRPVDGRAKRAQAVIKVVQRRKRRLADVARPAAVQLHAVTALPRRRCSSVLAACRGRCGGCGGCCRCCRLRRCLRCSRCCVSCHRCLHLWHHRRPRPRYLSRRRYRRYRRVAHQQPRRAVVHNGGQVCRVHCAVWDERHAGTCHLCQLRQALHAAGAQPRGSHMLGIQLLAAVRLQRVAQLGGLVIGVRAHPFPAKRAGGMPLIQRHQRAPDALRRLGSQQLWISRQRRQHALRCRQLLCRRDCSGGSGGRSSSSSGGWWR